MGLDIVELIMAVEETFQIDIQDEEAQAANTVGALYHLVLSKLDVQQSSTCLTSRAFYRTRRAIMEGLGIERKLLKPATLLEAIFPGQNRRADWHRVQQVTPLKLPALEHPVLVRHAFLAGGAAIGLIPVILGDLSWGWSVPLVLVGVIGGFFLRRSTPVLAVDFPNGGVTLGDLTRSFLALNYGQLLAQSGGVSQSEVWEKLCHVIIEQTGVTREQITPESRFVDDLGLD